MSDYGGSIPANDFSIGLKSGLYGGRNSNLIPASGHIVPSSELQWMVALSKMRTDHGPGNG